MVKRNPDHTLARIVVTLCEANYGSDPHRKHDLTLHPTDLTHQPSDSGATHMVRANDLGYLLGPCDAQHEQKHCCKAEGSAANNERSAV